MAEYVTTLKVTNDVAKRGVKVTLLSHNIIIFKMNLNFPAHIGLRSILTQDEGLREWLLQGVERNRRIFPTLMKKTLNF